MRPLSRIILALSLLTIATSWAAAAPLAMLEAGAQQPSLQLVRSGEDGVTVQFSLTDLQIEEVTRDGRTFQQITIPGGGAIGQVGDPQIPTFTRLLAIPDRAGVRVEATIESEEERDGIRLIPVQGDDGTPFALDQAAYQRDAYDDFAPAAAGDPAILREMRVVALTFQPVRYNPARQTIRIAREIRVQVHFEGENLTNEMTRRAQTIAPSFASMYQSLILNWQDALGNREVAPGAWVVICPNLTDVTTRLQPLVDWRQRKGLPTYVATTAETGTSNTSIKTWIQNAYNTWPTPPEYIVLAGDASGTYAIPTWFENLSGYGGEGDHPYVQLAGGDILADAHVGRLSFSSTGELETIVAKITKYESDPYMDDTSWYQRGCVVGDDSPSGYSCIQLAQWVKKALQVNGYTRVDSIYGEPFVTGMQTSFNAGISIFNYRGWIGMSGWGNNNTYGLTNGWKLPFVVTITCDTGTFANGTSRSEGFLRAGSATAPKGGIAAIGTATSGTHTAYNNCLNLGIHQGLLYEKLWTLGAALTRGKLEMYLNYQQDQPNRVTIWSYWNNLMGDPATECWTGVPQPVTVAHAASLPLGGNSFRATVTKLGQPVEDATVCVWKGTEVYASGETDGNGEIELPVAGMTAGNLLVTVTKHNSLPYLATVPVVSGQQFVGYLGSTVDDDNNGTSNGNADHIVNPRETVELRVQVKNFGTSPVTGVTGTLTCDDPYVTITDATETFGDLPANGSAWSADDFDFQVASGCPDGRVLRFGLELQSGSSNWHSLIDLAVVTGDIEIAGNQLYNVGANGILDPGESGQVSMKAYNVGGAAANGVVGTLVSLNPFLTVTDATGAFGDIPAGGQGENTTDRFGVSAGVEAYQGALATVMMTCSFNGGVIDTTYTNLTIGTRSSDDPVGPDHYGYYAFDDTDVSYPEAPSYSWIETDPSSGGQGTTVPLSDYGTYQDDSVVLDLPFLFQFYGNQFSKITVCSNGWIAMGSTFLTDYRNWTIPGAGSPNNMIAAFWDDLNLGSGGKVLTWFDAANHRFVIEWKGVRNEPGATQTFEIVLYDPAYYETPTGDGPVLLQYNTVNNNDSGDNYATVGIQNYDHTVGLLYTFYNHYASGAASLAAGRAIRLLPAGPAEVGSLSGVVQNASHGNAPIPGAEVALLESGRVFVTGEDGRYGGAVATGVYTVVARHPSFAPDTTSGVAITLGQQTVLNFSLTDILGPEITNVSNPMTTTDAAGPYPITATITDLSDVAEARLYYRLNGQGWIPAPMTANGDEWTGSIPGHSPGTQLDFYVWAKDGGGRSSTNPPDAPASFYTLFITQEMYGYTVEDPADPAWQIGAPGDDATSGLWDRLDPIGTTYNGQTIQCEDDHTPDPGVLCFVTGNGSVGGAAGDQDVDGGCTTLLSPIYDLSQSTLAFFTYYRWYAEGGNSIDDEFAVDVSSDGGQNWAPLERVPDNSASWVKVTKALHEVISLTDQVQFRFLACDRNSAGLVEAGIDDVALEVFTPSAAGAEEAEQGPAVFALYPSRPNPARAAGTTIRFSLPSAAVARLAVYDVSGRLVRELVHGSRQAGNQTVVWDGRDGVGSRVPSGLYFYRLDAAGQRQVQKLIVLQ
ncbi:MAG: C25 family cysteine peptidase [Candidatus Eisenbacteria bacterium]